MKVVFIASECNPIAKVGGLADVVGSLPKALKKLDIEPKIVIPRYGIIDHQKYPQQKLIDKIEIEYRSQKTNFSVWKTFLPNSDNIEVYLIDHPILSSNGVYLSANATADSFDEILRFGFFSEAAVKIIETFEDVDILHLNDWHTSIIPNLIKTQFKSNPRLAKIATVLTIHNMGRAYQGIAKVSILDELNLNMSKLSDLKADAQDGYIDFLEQGIRTVDMVNTVSETYASEIKTREYCEGLCSIVQNKGSHVRGILNGIDYQVFSPKVDKNLAKNFSIEDWKAGKSENKKDLFEKIGWQNHSDQLLIGMVTRLDAQKGIDLVVEILEKLEKTFFKLIILGTGDKQYLVNFQKLKEKFEGNFYYIDKFDPELASIIYAGSDAFLMPSRFEPCGLGQMIAMAYGSLPIVRKTGGLADSVEDNISGFVFEQFSSDELIKTLKRAVEIFNDQRKWSEMVENAMKADFSWHRSALEYVKMYKEAIEIRRLAASH